MLALLALGSGSSPAAVPEDEQVRAIVTALGARLDARAAAALEMVRDPGPRLLALRAYLRGSRTLPERWSWTEAQIRAFEGSSEQRDLLQEIDRVRAAFVAVNPGYELWVNPQVRSLDVQLEHWNHNDSVAAAASGLLAALTDRLSVPGAQPPLASHALDALAHWLESYVPSPQPSLAAPGLSPHGQMRAVDFQVHQKGSVVAGPSVASIGRDWDEAGWARRVEAAVRSSGGRFVGPLASPREPWHYTFVPAAVVTGDR